MVCNGGHGIVFRGELRENRPLDYEKARALYRQAMELGYGVYVALDDSDKVYGSSFRFYDQAGMRKEPSVYIIDEKFDPADHDAIYKMYVSIPESEEERLTLSDERQTPCRAPLIQTRGIGEEIGEHGPAIPRGRHLLTNLRRRHLHPFT